MKNTIGIIANPQSGRDIRRLIAHASVFDNMEKASIVERLLTIFEELGVKKVLAMPDGFGIVNTALYSLGRININVEFIQMKTWSTWEDTYEAAKIMKDECDVIVVIGGDGTNRIVAKVVDNTPVVPISTGTNNVFPYMIEATVAAEAAASIALGVVGEDEVTHKTKRIELLENGILKDIALIDAAATTYSFVGARAVWEPESLLELVLSRALPSNIGLSSIGGILKEIDDEDMGIYIEFGEGKKIKAPISPGVLREIKVKDFKVIALGEEIKLKSSSSMFALDGEREVDLRGEIKARITREGPAVVEYRKAIEIASKRGLFKIN